MENKASCKNIKLYCSEDYNELFNDHEYEQIYQTGYDDGFSDGFDDGKYNNNYLYKFNNFKIIDYIESYKKAQYLLGYMEGYQTGYTNGIGYFYMKNSLNINKKNEKYRF